MIQWCVDFAMSCGALSWSLEEVNSAEVYEALENLIDVNNGDHADEVLADIDTKVIARFLGAE